MSKFLLHHPNRHLCSSQTEGTVHSLDHALEMGFVGNCLLQIDALDLEPPAFRLNRDRSSATRETTSQRSP